MRDFDSGKLKERSEKWHPGSTIPVGVEIRGGQRVLSFDRAKSYLEKAQKIALLDCAHRMGEDSCDASVHVCMIIDKWAEGALDPASESKRHPEEISLEKALNVLKLSHEEGLIHMAFAIDSDGPAEDISSICSCCACCCDRLAGVIRYGLPTELVAAEAVSTTDGDLCADCGTCADWCLFGARSVVDGHIAFNADLCKGCAQCASHCPNHAVGLMPT